MKSTKAASRYAKSFLELAMEQNKVEQVAADLAYVRAVSKETKEFAILLQSPVINASKKLDIFSVLFGHFDSLTTSFIRLITNNRREYMLAEIAASFEAQWKAARGIVPVTIISATALDSATKESITKKIQAVVTGSLEINEIVDESLIGGFIVRMEDKQMDASVASQFNNLKQRLTR